MVGVIQTVEELKSALNNPHLSQKEKRKIRNKINKRSDKYKEYKRNYSKRVYLTVGRRLTEDSIRNKKNWSREYNRRPEIKITKNLRKRIWRTVTNKCNTSMNLIGCTPQELRRHLELQFQDGMSWDNYSMYGWHIDHIKPCSSFDLSDPEQQKQCFHYTNLQPMWWRDNLSKGARF